MDMGDEFGICSSKDFAKKYIEKLRKIDKTKGFEAISDIFGCYNATEAQTAILSKSTLMDTVVRYASGDKEAAKTLDSLSAYFRRHNNNPDINILETVHKVMEEQEELEGFLKTGKAEYPHDICHAVSERIPNAQPDYAIQTTFDEIKNSKISQAEKEFTKIAEKIKGKIKIKNVAICAAVAGAVALTAGLIVKHIKNKKAQKSN